MGDEFSYEQLTAWDIERIELVRGPQSALWGSDALGGRLERDDPARRVRAARRWPGGGRQLRQQPARRPARRNRGQRWSADLSASRYATDGINVSARVDESDGFAGDRDDRYENLTASFNGEFRASPALRLGLFGRYSDSASDFDALGFDGLPRGRGSPLRRRAGIAARQRRIRPDGRTLAPRTACQPAGLRSREPRRWQPDQYPGRPQNRPVLSDQLRLRSAASGEYRGILAVDFERENFAQSFADFDGANQAQSRDTRGYVAEFIAQPIDPLNLSVSLRYDDFSNISNKTTYRVTGSYRLESTDSRLHGSYGTGLKQPTFTELFGFFPDSFVGNPQLTPEESTGWDIGLEQQVWDGRVRFDVTYFDGPSGRRDPERLRYADFPE